MPKISKPGAAMPEAEVHAFGRVTARAKAVCRLPLSLVLIVGFYSAYISPPALHAQGQPDAAAKLEEKMEELAAEGRYGEAIPLADRLSEILKKNLGENHPAYVKVLYRLASFYSDNGQYDMAEQVLLKAAVIVKNVLGDKSPHYSVSITYLALLYEKTGRYGEAEPLLVQSTRIWEAINRDGSDYATSLDHLGNLYTDTGRYDEAEQLLLKAAQIRKKASGGNDPDYASGLNNLGVLYMTTGRFDKAEPLLLQAEGIEKNAGVEDPSYLQILGNLANLYSETGRYEEAEPRLQRVLDLSKKVFGESRPEYALSLQSLAVFYMQTGRYDKAEPLYELARQIIKRTVGEGSDIYLGNINDLAELYEKTGRLDKAEPLYTQSLEISKKVYGEKHRQYAWALNNAGSFYLFVGRYGESEALLLSASRISKEALGENSNLYAASLNNLAELYRRTGQYEKAEPLIKKTLEITGRVFGEEHPFYAHSLSNLAGIYQTTGRKELALQTLSRGMEIEQRSLTRVFNVSSERAMYSYLSTFSSSIYLLLSLIYDQQKTTGAEVEEAFSWVLRRKALILDTLMRFRQAQSLAQADPVIAERAARMRSLRQQLSNFPINPPPGLDDAALREKIGNLTQEIEIIEAELDRRLSEQRPTQAGGKVKTDELRQQIRPGAALVEFMRAEMFDYKAAGNNRAWKPARYFAFVVTGEPGARVRMIDLKEAGPIDEAVREVRDSIADSSKFFKGRTEQQVREAERDREDGYREFGKKLYGLVFEKVRKGIGNATTIYVAPDGQLNLVPFEALVDEKDKYLIESYRFAYLSSGRDLLRAAGAVGRGTVIFGDPDYDLKAEERASELALLKQRVVEKASAGAPAAQPPANKFRGGVASEVRLKEGAARWDRLEDSAVEADEIERLLSGSAAYAPVRKYLGPQALEETFKAVVSPRVLHLSTHGFFLKDQPGMLKDSKEILDASNPALIGERRLQRAGDDNPLLRSGLVLAGANALGESSSSAALMDDGWVTAEEISLMQLQGTELVVLSACETGLGDVQVGEGVYGLRRAFLNAGARTLISTLFKVPSRQSAEIMGQFYDGLKEGKKGKLESLHDAQLWAINRRREQGGAAHPFFWAGFVLVGDPN